MQLDTKYKNVEDMLDNIYPLLHLHMKWNEKQMKLKDIKFNTIKQNHFEKTIKVAELIKNNGYKTDEGLKTIVD